MRKTILVLLLSTVLSACGQAEAPFDVAAHEQEVMDWRAARLERLLAPEGYLTQTGLFWLEEGNYRFGSNPDNDIVIPGDAAPFIGVFEIGEEGVRMIAEPGIDVRSDDRAVTTILIADDTTESPVQIKHRTLAWAAVKRDGRFAIRVRDFEHPFARTFGPLNYFAIDASRRVIATLNRYDEPQIANVGTVIEGLGYHPESPGTVSFEIDGQVFELEAYTSGDRLFFVFGDQTNRDDTYGAGRFLYADGPDANGETVLDFNKAYSPPCAFNDFSTCPVASPRNRLSVRVEAGEKYDPALHYSADVAH